MTLIFLRIVKWELLNSYNSVKELRKWKGKMYSVGTSVEFLGNKCVYSARKNRKANGGK